MVPNFKMVNIIICELGALELQRTLVEPDFNTGLLQESWTCPLLQSLSTTKLGDYVLGSVRPSVCLFVSKVGVGVKVKGRGQGHGSRSNFWSKAVNIRGLACRVLQRAMRVITSLRYLSVCM